MSLLKLNSVLLICFYFTTVSGFFNLRNGYRFLLEDLNITGPKIQVANRTIIQPLDHFNDNDERTWSMRYFEGLEYWKQGGPVFLFCGESEANTDCIRFGLTHDLAQETNGALYMSEHRYYGKSMPLPELNIKNMAFLSSRQALADIAKLLKQIKALPQYTESKVVVVGGSYPGNLAAWMRLLYHDLVDAAIASSAPVLAKADFYEYLETVGKDYKRYGTPGCYDKIVTKFNRYDRLFQTKAGIDQLKQEELICNSTDFSKLENRHVFFSMKMIDYASTSQYGNPKEIKLSCVDGKLYSVRKKSFKELMSYELSSWNEDYSCNEYTVDSFIRNLNMKAWIYQTCTEFGYFQTTTSENQPFTRNQPIEFFYSICSNLYGAEFDKIRVDEGVKKTNDMYGGLKPNVTRVVFVNGDMDPWHRLGVLHDLSEDAPAKLVHETSHCEDLVSERSDLPEEMKETRKYVKSLIKKWIGAGEYKNVL